MIRYTRFLISAHLSTGEYVIHVCDSLRIRYPRNIVSALSLSEDSLPANFSIRDFNVFALPKRTKIFIPHKNRG